MTVTAIEPQGRKKRRAVPVPPGIPATGIGQPSDGYCVAAFDFAEAINPAIEKLDRSLEPDIQEANLRHRGNGAVEIVGAHAARMMNLPVAAAVRRLYAGRTGETRALSAEWADCLLLGAGLSITTDAPGIAHLPGGVEAAREMVDCHFEFGTDEEPDELTKSRLARMLVSFTKGYLAGVNADITTDTEEWARYVSGHRLDQHNRRRPLDRVLRREQESDAA